MRTNRTKQNTKPNQTDYPNTNPNYPNTRSKKAKIELYENMKKSMKDMNVMSIHEEKDMNVKDNHNGKVKDKNVKDKHVDKVKVKNKKMKKSAQMSAQTGHLNNQNQGSLQNSIKKVTLSKEASLKLKISTVRTPLKMIIRRTKSKTHTITKNTLNVPYKPIQASREEELDP